MTENIPHHLCGKGVYCQTVFILRVLPISVNRKGAHKVAPFSLYRKLAPDFYGNVTAVRLVYQIFKGNQQTIHLSAFVLAVIIVVNGDKAYAKKRKNPFYVFPRLQIIPSEAGQVLHHDAINPSGSYLLHHLPESRPFKIGSRKTVVHLHAALYKMRVAA